MALSARGTATPRLSALGRQPASVGAGPPQTRRTPRRLSDNGASPIRVSASGGPTQEQPAEDAAVRVAIRVRPLLPNEAGQKEGVRTTDRFVALTDDRGQERFFTADVVLDSRPRSGSGGAAAGEDAAVGRSARGNAPSPATQNVVYEVIGQPLVQKVLEGYNACLLAYGHTGSGKTHTVLGEQMCRGSVAFDITAAGQRRQLDARAPSAGLLPRALEALYLSLQKEQQLTCTASFYEVYNERVQDLLAPPPPVASEDDVAGVRRRKASIRPSVHFHPRFGAFIDCLSEVGCPTLEEALQAVVSGMAVRSTASTLVNERSSRSHAIFSLRIEREKTTNSLMMVDLAGREQEKVTQAVRECSERFKELTLINRSLFHLAHCVRTLAAEGGDRGVSVTGSGQGHHFRNSKLTMLLGHALAGNSYTAVVGTISPRRSAHEDSLATLRFCESVKQVRTRPVVNDFKSEDAVRYLEDEVRRLSTELSRANTGRQLLERQLSEAQSMMEYYRQSLCEAHKSHQPGHVEVAAGPLFAASATLSASTASTSTDASKARSPGRSAGGANNPLQNPVSARGSPPPKRRGVKDVIVVSPGSSGTSVDRSAAVSWLASAPDLSDFSRGFAPANHAAGDGDAAGGGRKDGTDEGRAPRSPSPPGQRRGSGVASALLLPPSRPETHGQCSAGGASAGTSVGVSAPGGVRRLYSTSSCGAASGSVGGHEYELATDGDGALVFGAVPPPQASPPPSPSPKIAPPHASGSSRRPSVPASAASQGTALPRVGQPFAVASPSRANTRPAAHAMPRTDSPFGHLLTPVSAAPGWWPPGANYVAPATTAAASHSAGITRLRSGGEASSHATVATIFTSSVAGEQPPAIDSRASIPRWPSTGEAAAGAGVPRWAADAGSNSAWSPSSSPRAPAAPAVCAQSPSSPGPSLATLFPLQQFAVGAVAAEAAGLDTLDDRLKRAAEQWLEARAQRGDPPSPNRRNLVDVVERLRSELVNRHGEQPSSVQLSGSGCSQSSHQLPVTPRTPVALLPSNSSGRGQNLSAKSSGGDAGGLGRRLRSPGAEVVLSPRDFSPLRLTPQRQVNAGTFHQATVLSGTAVGPPVCGAAPASVVLPVKAVMPRAVSSSTPASASAAAFPKWAPPSTTSPLRTAPSPASPRGSVEAATTPVCNRVVSGGLGADVAGGGTQSPKPPTEDIDASRGVPRHTVVPTGGSTRRFAEGVLGPHLVHPPVLVATAPPPEIATPRIGLGMQQVPSFADVSLRSPRAVSPLSRTRGHHPGTPCVAAPGPIVRRPSVPLLSSLSPSCSGGAFPMVRRMDSTASVEASHGSPRVDGPSWSASASPLLVSERASLGSAWQSAVVLPTGGLSRRGSKDTRPTAEAHPDEASGGMCAVAVSPTLQVSSGSTSAQPAVVRTSSGAMSCALLQPQAQALGVAPMVKTTLAAGNPEVRVRLVRSER